MGIDYITFGGVNLKKSEVKSMETKIIKDKHGNEEKVYIVNFNNGVKASYRGGENTSYSNSYISSPNINDAKFSNTNVYSVFGLELQGSANHQDQISIVGGSIVGVDVSNDDNADSVNITCAGVHEDSYGVFTEPPVFEGQVRVSKEDKTRIVQEGETTVTKDGSPLRPNGFGVHRVEW